MKSVGHRRSFYDRDVCTTGRKIPREELIQELKRLNREVDGTPLTTEMNEISEYNAQTYRKRFGSWADALEEAGLEPGPRQSQNQNIPRSELIEELRKMGKMYAETPSSRDMDQYGKFSTTPYEEEFGSWNEAVEAAGLPPTSPAPEDR